MGAKKFHLSVTACVRLGGESDIGDDDRWAEETNTAVSLRFLCGHWPLRIPTLGCQTANWRSWLYQNLGVKRSTLLASQEVALAWQKHREEAQEKTWEHDWGQSCSICSIQLGGCGIKAVDKTRTQIDRKKIAAMQDFTCQHGTQQWCPSSHVMIFCQGSE